jgi:hypothetical protein
MDQTDRWRQLPPPDPKFCGVIKEDALQIEALVGTVRYPPEGRAERLADHHGRRRLRGAERLRR